MSISNKLIQAASGNAGSDNLYVEDVFSTFLYDGNSSTQTITNGLDLAGEGGLVWIKARNSAATHGLYDTERGATKRIDSTTSNGESTYGDSLTSFDASGFSIGARGDLNQNSIDFASWTFRKAEKFFDVVTYTGTGATQNITHALGSVPACIIVKNTSSAADWAVYHASIDNVEGVSVTAQEAFLYLNLPGIPTDDITVWNDTAPTDSVFTVRSDARVGTNGATYVAYLFASDAGGFGDDGDENIIKCGSFTTDSNAKFFANTGFEPQWVLVKRSDGSGAWNLLDTMRGLLSEGTAGGKYVRPNTSADEATLSSTASEYINATGFGGNGGGVTGSANATFIYMAIRRPMKTPESGTEVFALHNPGYPLNSAGEAFTSGFPVDWALSKEISASDDWIAMSRLQGAGNRLKPNTTGAEAGGISSGTFDHMTGWYKTTSANMSWMFKRAPGFMDVVAWTGNNNTNQRVAHNLTVAPELIIYKGRNKVNYWRVYSGNINQYIALNLDNPIVTWPGFWGTSAPTATDFGFNAGLMDLDAFNAVAYLFATLAGVSKVGSVVHSGTTNVDCGFSAGARFVMAKRTDASGDWFIWDSVRGIVSGDDPYVRWNVSSAEVTNTDYIDPLSSGFTLTSSFTAGTYIFLAIA